MEEALGADGHGFLEQHDALIGLVAEELQGGEAARRRHVEMLPATRGYDQAFCCVHVGSFRISLNRDSPQFSASASSHTRPPATPGAGGTAPSRRGVAA